MADDRADIDTVLGLLLGSTDRRKKTMVMPGNSFHERPEVKKKFFLDPNAILIRLSVRKTEKAA